MSASAHGRSWTHPGRPSLDAAGPGPWDCEPDKVQWIDAATGLDCLIVRNPLGALCGYVGLPPGHPFHGVDYDQCTRADCTVDRTVEWCPEHSPNAAVEVHGGLTFADFCRESDKGEAFGICHVPFPGRPAHVWWLGFDCAHGGDLTPRLGLSFPGDEYRDLAYVKAQCATLARQLAAVTA